MDRGDEPIADTGERAQLRAQARGVHARALAAAAVLTAISLLVPQ
jgi:hypothetical protein